METKIVIFNGEEYRRSPKSKYYFKYTTRNCERRNAKQLHRAVWEYHNGEIPKGYHIHHIDGNIDNNDISNLECIPAREHLSMHAKKNMENEEYRERNRQQLEEARELANEWHRSEQGREWHREHAKRSILKGCAHDKEKVCEYCGKEFLGTAIQKYCSVTCQRKARTKRINKFGDHIRICECCGEEYEAKKYNQRFCSSKCKQRFYAQNKRLQSNDR